MEWIEVRTPKETEGAITRVVEVLDRGGIAVLPTEGVYGFHLRVDRPVAVERLRSLKGAGARRGWIGLISEPDGLARYASPLPPQARALARAHWPGALTLVVSASIDVPEALRGPDGTVALRCPGSDLLRAVARASEGLLLSTSANRPGRNPPARAEDAETDGVDLVLDAGPLTGLPSTIVRVDPGGCQILREGAVRVGGSGA